MESNKYYKNDMLWFNQHFAYFAKGKTVYRGRIKKSWQRITGGSSTLKLQTIKKLKYIPKCAPKQFEVALKKFGLKPWRAMRRNK